MNIRYDKTIDAMYIPLKRGIYAHSKKVTDGIVVDIAKTGKVIGIEILDASKTITGFNPSRISISSSYPRQSPVV